MRPGSPLASWPLPPGADSAVIDAAGTHILDISLQIPDGRSGVTGSDIQLQVLNLATSQTRVLASRNIRENMLSDDGALAVWVQDDQAFVVSTDGSGQRAVPTDPAGITVAVLSGNGKVVWAGTKAGRLLKFDVNTGGSTEVVGRTPFLAQTGALFDAGMMATMGGAGLSNSALQGTPPLNPWLGDSTMWMGERKVPVFAVSPTQVRFLIPWDTPASRTLQFLRKRPQ